MKMFASNLMDLRRPSFCETVKLRENPKALITTTHRNVVLAPELIALGIVKTSEI